MNLTAHNVLKMSKKTKLHHKFGCGGPNNDPANSMTLADISKLYEKVATGVLNQSNRTKFYNLMSTGKSSMYPVIEEEAQKLGLSNSTVQSFKSKIETAAKPGSFKTGGKYYRSIGGWIAIPLKNGSKREYTFALFIDEADEVDEDFSNWEARGELLREQFRSALKTFK